MMHWGPHVSGWGGWTWWGLGSLLLTLLFVAGVVLLVVLLARSSRGTGQPSAGDDRALEILRERFARGEITPEQFDEMRRILNNSS